MSRLTEFGPRLTECGPAGETYRVNALALLCQQGSDVLAMRELRARLPRVRSWVEIRRRG